MQNPNDPNFGNYGSAFASFLLGLPDSANRSNSQELELRNWDFSPYIQDDIKLSPRLTVNLGLRWDIQAPFTENHNNCRLLQSRTIREPSRAGTSPGRPASLATALDASDSISGDIHYGHFGPRFGFAYQLSKKMVLQGGLDIAFLDGGAYEYGTNKVAVNYGNLLTGSFTRNSTGSFTSSFGSWDTNPIPAVNPTPFSPGLGAATRSTPSARRLMATHPTASSGTSTCSASCRTTCSSTAAWVGNRIIHLPSQNNRINQMDPKYLAHLDLSWQMCSSRPDTRWMACHCPIRTS